MESLGFRDWLMAQEASTDYLRNPGTRQLMYNPFQRAAHDTTPYHIQAIDRGGDALSSVFQKSMYKTTQAPTPYVGYGGSYEGLDDSGLTITVLVDAAQVGNDPTLAKYHGLKNAIEQLKATGRTEQYDIQQAMVSKATFLKQTAKGEVYPVEVLFPFAGHTLERQRDKDFARDVLDARRDLPDILANAGMGSPSQSYIAGGSQQTGQRQQQPAASGAA